MCNPAHLIDSYQSTWISSDHWIALQPWISFQWYCCNDVVGFNIICLANGWNGSNIVGLTSNHWCKLLQIRLAYVVWDEEFSIILSLRISLLGFVMLIGLMSLRVCSIIIKMWFLYFSFVKIMDFHLFCKLTTSFESSWFYSALMKMWNVYYSTYTYIVNLSPCLFNTTSLIPFFSIFITTGWTYYNFQTEYINTQKMFQTWYIFLLLYLPIFAVVLPFFIFLLAMHVIEKFSVITTASTFPPFSGV